MKIKKLGERLASLVFSLALISSSVLSVQAGYSDVSADDPDLTGIEFCEEQGLMTGYEDGKFHGSDSLSRGMLATILWRIFGSQDAYGNGYGDVPSWSFYKEASSWVQEQGLMTGNEHENAPNTFDGEDPVRRQDLSLIFYRLAANVFNEDTGTESQPVLIPADFDETEGYALQGVSWALNNTLIDLVDNDFLPGSASTRAITAVMLQRYFEPRMDLLNDLKVNVPSAGEQNWKEINTIIQPEQSSLRYESNGGYYYPSNQLLVFFEKGVSDAAIDEVIDSVDGVVIGRNAILNLFQIQLPKKQKVENLMARADTLMKSPVVKYATIDIGLGNSSAYIPNDPWNGDVDPSDWMDGDIDGSNWWAEAINLIPAWEIAQNLPVSRIGVIDTQVRENHQDLSGIVSFLDEDARNRNTQLKNSDSPDSVNRYHGTAVTALIGARHNNNAGLSGVIPNASIVFAPWFNAMNTGNHLNSFLWDSTVYDTVTRMVASGIQVVNLSFSRSNGVVTFDNELTRTIMKRDNALAGCVMDALLDNGFNKFMIVQSAGNGNYRYQAIPAAYAGFFNALSFGDPGIQLHHSFAEMSTHYMMVGAVTPPVSGLYPKVTYSNYADGMNFIYAPGRNLFSATAWESFESDYNDQLQGTSFAAPIVAGIISLMWTANPGLSPERIQQILQETAYNTVAPLTSGSGTKMVNAASALQTAING